MTAVCSAGGPRSTASSPMGPLCTKQRELRYLAFDFFREHVPAQCRLTNDVLLLRQRGVIGLATALAGKPPVFRCLVRQLGGAVSDLSVPAGHLGGFVPGQLSVRSMSSASDSHRIAMSRWT